MFALSIGSVEKYLQRVEDILGPDSEPPALEPIQFDLADALQVLERNHPVEQGHMLVHLSSTKDLSSAWDTVRDQLERRLFTEAWLQEVIKSDDLVVLFFARDSLREHLFNPHRTRPIRMSIEQVKGQMRTFRETPPDNMTKTLDVVEHINASLAFLRGLETPEEMQLYNTNMDEVQRLISEANDDLIRIQWAVDTELFPSDESMAQELQDVEYHHAAAAVKSTQSNPIPDQELVDALKKAGTPAPELPKTSVRAPERPVPPLFPSSFVESVTHPPDCKCYICASFLMDPSIWHQTTNNHQLDCHICIAPSDTESEAYIDRVMCRLKRWNCPVHYVFGARKEVMSVLEFYAPNNYPWPNRDLVWEHVPRDMLFNACCMVLAEAPNKMHGSEFQSWLSCKLNKKQGTYIHAAVLICLLWASVETDAHEAAIIVPVAHWTWKYHEHFRRLRFDEK